MSDPLAGICFRRVEPVCLQISAPVSAFGAERKLHSLGHRPHLVARPNTLGTVPQFATNRQGSTWVEPAPQNASSLLRRLPRSLSHVAIEVLQCVLGFLAQCDLAESAVLVNRHWCQAIRRDNILNGRRFAFRHASDYDGNGILAYLGRRSVASATLKQFARVVPHGDTLLQRNLELVQNPATALRPLVRAYASSFDGVVSPDSLASALCSAKVSRFVTDKMPFAWVGVDMLSFGVTPSAYTVGSSVDANDPAPLRWELQGTQTTASAGWETSHWDVIDRQQTNALQPGAATASCTFSVSCSTPYRRFRIVQTSVNSHWGHELVVSGFELYGTLHRFGEV